MLTLDAGLSYALYAFALSYLLLFGAFFLNNDWALRFLFRYPLRPLLAQNPSADLVSWSSIGMVFHRMEASFGLGLGVFVVVMTRACAGNLAQLSAVSACVAAHAVFVALNHTLNYAGRAEFCRQSDLPMEVRRTVGVLRFAAWGMALLYGVAAAFGATHAGALSG
jgi:hypothetical protein